MKHIKKILAIISLAAAATACFAACGGDEQNVPPAHDHSFSSEWSYDEQSHWHASSCEHDWLKSDEAAHVFTESKQGTETCTEGATITRTCTCGYSYSYETEPLGHEWVEVEGKDPTCTEAGYTAYEKCSHEGCDAERGKREIPAVGHNYHYELVKDEEGQETGEHQQVCGFCGEVKAGSKAAHNFGTTYKHDETGHWQACVCGKTTEKQNHDAGENPEITGKDAEFHWTKCEVCNEPMEKTAHNWGEEIAEVEATCTAGGHSAYQECEDCGEKKGYEEYEALGHTYEAGEYETDGTDHWQVCTRCDEESAHEAHEYAEGVYETDEDNHWQVCTVCGEETTHTAHTPSADFTGKDEAQHWYECTACGNKTGAADHTWTDVEAKDATCDEDGYTAHQLCEACGATKGKVEQFATGHNYVRKSDDTNHWMECTKCSEQQEGTLQAHTTGDDYLTDGTNHWKQCTVCEKQLEKGEHTYDGEHYDSNDTQHWLVCDVCAAPSATKEAHQHNSLGQCVCGHIEESGKTYFTYELDGNNYVVTGLAAELDGKTEFAIPATHEGKPVVAIAEGAFSGNTVLTKLVLAPSITTIGDFAFEGCTGLTEIVMPGVTALGTFDYQVFNGCTALQTVTLPAGVTVIGQNMFKGCKELATVIVEGSLTKIDTQAFYGCTKLTALTLKGTLSYLGQRAFAGSGIQSLSIAFADGARIAQGAFENCASLQTLSITGGITYFASPILQGCNALKSLTIPFVGDNIDAAQATDTHFGYIFGKNAEGEYDIPTSLKAGTGVTIKGGSVERHAFDGCGTLEVFADAAVKVKTISFVDYVGWFHWTGDRSAFVEPTLTLTSAATANIEEKGTYQLTYTLKPTLEDYPEMRVEHIVYKDYDQAIKAVKGTDYNVDEETLTYTFLKEGTYTVCVEATLNGITPDITATITVQKERPHITNVQIEGGEDGKYYTETPIELSYDVTAGSTITFTVKNDATGKELEAGADKDYTRNDNTFTFHKPGKILIVITASLPGVEATTHPVRFTVADKTATAPTIGTFSADKPTLTEGGEAATLTVDNITYGDGDSEGSMTYEVFIQEQGEGSYVNATEGWYELDKAAKTFKAKIAGNYRITLTVVSAQGGTSSKDLDITVEAVELEDQFKLVTAATNTWVRVKSDDTAQKVTYSMNNLYLDGYNVKYEAINDVVPEAVAEELAFTVKLGTPNTTVVTITYTHKNIADKEYTFEVPVSFVSNLEKSPVLGTDPFGGTYGELLTATGLQLYWDVTDKASEGSQLAMEDIGFAVVNGTNTTGVTASILHVNGNEKLPYYILIEDWNPGTATGEVAVKLTATKGDATAAATKLFKVTALPDPNKANGMNDYADKVMNGKRGAMDFDIIMDRTSREHFVLTKEGVFVHRGGTEGWEPTNNMFCVEPNGINNFQVDFDYMIVKRLTEGNTQNKASFKINMRTNRWEGYMNGDGEQTAIYAEGTETQISCGFWGEGQDWSGRSLPEATIGQLIHIRLTHRLHTDTNKVEWLWQWSLTGDDFASHKWFRIEANATTEDAKIGSPVYAMQFAHEQGSYYLGSFKLTNLDANA